ncbi:MAG TPA: hypothetical protein VF003_17350, partial [Pseudonocardiaceae bacterium]
MIPTRVREGLHALDEIFALPQATAMDDQFGTHTSSTRPALRNATARSRVGPRFLVPDLSRPVSIWV